MAFYEGNSPMTDVFPSQRISNTESVSMSWRHHINKIIFFRVLSSERNMFYISQPHSCCLIILYSTVFNEHLLYTKFHEVSEILHDYYNFIITMFHLVINGHLCPRLIYYWYALKQPPIFCNAFKLSDKQQRLQSIVNPNDCETVIICTSVRLTHCGIMKQC